MNRVLLATLAGLTTFALAAPVGATQTVNIPSTITITGHSLHFHGKVGASNSACRGDRKVRLFTAGGVKLGTTKTKGNGSWKLTVSGSAGITMESFYARVKKLSQGTAGTIYVCAAAHTTTIPYFP